MKAVLVKSQGPEDKDVVVIVNDTDDDLHARLVAWYYKYGVANKVAADQLLKGTVVFPTIGPVSANIYKKA